MARLNLPSTLSVTRNVQVIAMVAAVAMTMDFVFVGLDTLAKIVQLAIVRMRVLDVDTVTNGAAIASAPVISWE